MYEGKIFSTDLSQGIDISIPLKHGTTGPKCFYAPDFRIEPVIAGDFVGSTDNGSPVNFKNIYVNPHGNGTHTECAGHITSLPLTINQCLLTFHFVAKLITVDPDEKADGDKVITETKLKEKLAATGEVVTLIVRTLPNDHAKLTKDYSGTNPPYFSPDAIKYINEIGIQHLVTDLPSIDREVDGGAVLGHKIFWGYPEFAGRDKTITEMVYIPDAVLDGIYFCNIQIASIESDASPSKIVIYALNEQ